MGDVYLQIFDNHRYQSHNLKRVNKLKLDYFIILNLN